MSTTDASVLMGISARQLDYWVTLGHIQASETHPGSGVWREFSEFEVQVGSTMARLRDADLPLQVAARAAREHVEKMHVRASDPFLHELADMPTRFELAPGVALMIEVEEDDADA